MAFSSFKETKLVFEKKKMLETSNFFKFIQNDSMCAEKMNGILSSTFSLCLLFANPHNFCLETPLGLYLFHLLLFVSQSLPQIQDKGGFD